MSRKLPGSEGDPNQAPKRQTWVDPLKPNNARAEGAKLLNDEFLADSIGQGIHKNFDSVSLLEGDYGVRNEAFKD